MPCALKCSRPMIFLSFTHLKPPHTKHSLNSDSGTRHSNPSHQLDLNFPLTHLLPKASNSNSISAPTTWSASSLNPKPKNSSRCPSSWTNNPVLQPLSKALSLTSSNPCQISTNSSKAKPNATMWNRTHFLKSKMTATSPQSSRMKSSTGSSEKASDTIGAMLRHQNLREWRTKTKKMRKKLRSFSTCSQTSSTQKDLRNKTFPPTSHLWQKPVLYKATKTPPAMKEISTTFQATKTSPCTNATNCKTIASTRTTAWPAPPNPTHQCTTRCTCTKWQKATPTASSPCRRYCFL